MRNSNRSSYFSGLFSFYCREHFVAFVNDRGKTLKVEVRDLCSDEEWHGNFSPNYIEELTKRTGNFKRFDVFLAMLHSLLCQRTKSLSIDFVSYGDLENFQKTRLKRNSLGFSVCREISASRRYLILTYVSDFDQTFYPLPLTYFGVVDKETLFERIHKLRNSCFNKSTHRGLVGSFGSSFDVDERKNRIAVLESERDNALAELNRLRSVLHALYGKDGHELRNVSFGRNCSPYGTNRPTTSSKTMPFSSKDCSTNQRSISMSTPLHNSEDHLHHSVIQGTANRMDSMTNNSERSLLLGGHLCGSPHSLPTSRSRGHCQRPRMSFNSPRKCCRSSSLYLSRSRRFDPTAYVYEQRKKQQEVKQKRKLEEISRLSHQSPSPTFYHRSHFPAVRRVVTPDTQLSTSTLQKRRPPLRKQCLNKSATVVTSRRWDRLTSNENDFSDLSDCNPQHAYRLMATRDTVNQLNRSGQTRISSPSDAAYLSRELNEVNRRLDDLQGRLGDCFTHPHIQPN